MIKVSELKEDVVYRRTRASSGLQNTYAMVVSPKRITRMRKRLITKVGKSPQEARALGAIERGEVLIEIFHRYTTGKGERKETSSFLGLRPEADIALREVKHKPGYTSQERS